MEMNFSDSNLINISKAKDELLAVFSGEGRQNILTKNNYARVYYKNLFKSFDPALQNVLSSLGSNLISGGKMVTLI